MEPHLDMGCHQIKHPFTGMAYISKGCWYHGILQTTQAIAKGIGSFQQTHGKTLLLKSTPRLCLFVY